jgi:hypothetical protein
MTLYLQYRLLVHFIDKRYPIEQGVPHCSHFIINHFRKLYFKIRRALKHRPFLLLEHFKILKLLKLLLCFHKRLNGVPNYSECILKDSDWGLGDVFDLQICITNHLHCKYCRLVDNALRLRIKQCVNLQQLEHAH